MLLLEGGTSSSDINVTVIPSDQSSVSAEGMRCVSHFDGLVSVEWSGNGVDYTSTPITATFPAGATSVTVDVPVTMDNLAEQTERFDLGFMILTSLSGQVTEGRITEAVGIISDTTRKMIV